MTKREVLLAICETPGWEPPEDSSQLTVALSELVSEGWVLPRLDGYEASGRALDEYPRFPSSPDVADPTPDPKPATPDPDERLLMFVIGLMAELPLPKILDAAHYRPTLPPGEMVREIAQAIIEGML